MDEDDLEDRGTIPHGSRRQIIQSRSENKRHDAWRCRLSQNSLLRYQVNVAAAFGRGISRALFPKGARRHDAPSTRRQTNGHGAKTKSQPRCSWLARSWAQQDLNL